MKAAVLGNGPSRHCFNTPTEYDVIVGCNIPWTKVDYLVVLDESVVDFWCDKESGNKTIFSKRAYQRYLDSSSDLTPHVIFTEVAYGIETSAHIAVLFLIQLGYTAIDVYGCDSRFSNVTKSRTNDYVAPVRKSRDFVKHWNANWDEIIVNNPSITINFVRN